jgi:hypothetical protein
MILNFLQTLNKDLALVELIPGIRSTLFIYASSFLIENKADVNIANDIAI